MSLDPNKTYLIWNGSEFPNSSNAQFKAPAGSSIDWGDGTVETFETASSTVTTHNYTDGLTEHTIAISGLTEIVNGTFWSLSNLTGVTIGNGVTRIGDGAFHNCSSLTNVIIPNSVTRIGGSAFYNCSSLTSVTIPDSVTSISNSAFGYCSSLTSITIPDGVTGIGDYAFGYCSSLMSIEIPASVTSIRNGGFYGCTSLQSIVIFAETPPTLGADAIPSNVQSIYVQQSSKAEYQIATNWNTFASKIVSNNLYLSFIRFNQKNKGYIDEKVNDSAVKTKNEVAIELQKISDKADEAESIAKGRATGYVFDTKADMDAWLENPENVSNLVLGDNLYIRATDVPDYWWDGSSAQMLETQKVDLTDYVKNTDYASTDGTVAGLLAVNKNKGIGRANLSPSLEIVAAEESAVIAKIGNYKPLTPATLDLAVKVGVTTNTEALTDEEKDAACEWLGALEKPETPTEESAVTILADGTVGTKPLSEIGGGGSSSNLYSHVISFNDDTYSLSVGCYIISTESNPYTKQTFPDNVAINWNNSIYDISMNLGININIFYSKNLDELSGDYLIVSNLKSSTMHLKNPIMFDTVNQL